VLTNDNIHTVSVWDWSNRIRLAKSTSCKCDVRGLVCNPFSIDRSLIEMVVCGENTLSYFRLWNAKTSKDGNVKKDPSGLHVYVCMYIENTLSYFRLWNAKTSKDGNVKKDPCVCIYICMCVYIYIYIYM
jgi:hypothetical protein